MSDSLHRPTCPRCERPLRTCLCGFVRPCDNQVELLILQHPLEVGEAKGSAKLLQLSLAACDVVVGECFEPDMLEALLGADCALLYPAELRAPGVAPASASASASAQASAPAPKRLVVLDGTWRKSRKMLWLNPALQALPRISLDDAPPSRYRIRKAQRPGQLATLEAACRALQQLESRSQPYAALLDAFDGFIVLHEAVRIPRQRGQPKTCIEEGVTVTSQDHETLDAVRAWLATGHRAWLVTVATTFGASPRPPGSLMAIRDDGLCIGSVSGGCIEDDLIARRFEFEGTKPALATYGVLAEDAQRFGLPCGGTVTVLVEAGVPAAALGELCSALQARQVVRRTVDLASGAWQLSGDESDFAVTLRAGTLTCAHGPRHRLLIIGGSEIAHHLCRIAISLDYAVHVCEPRDEYRRSWRLPDDVQWQDGMPDDVVQAMKPDARTVIVTVSHDPKLDDMALMEALKSPAAWVGAVGSVRTSQARRERLLTLDLSEEQVNRLHAPVGLPIGSRTPAEIAVAIAAELVALRSGRRLKVAEQAVPEPGQ